MEQNKEPRNKSTLYSQYLKEEASTYNAHISRDSLFNKWHWENWTDTCRKMKLAPFYAKYKNKFKMD